MGSGMVAPLVESGLHCGTNFAFSTPRADQVAPLVESGLHCGAFHEDEHDYHDLVAPLVESGLHCGEGLACGRCGPMGVAPLVESGLHCGCLVTLSVRNIGKDQSPRSSRAGSIAACVVRSLVEAMSAPVAPLVESGLHCGGPICGQARTTPLVAPLVESGLHCGW